MTENIFQMNMNLNVLNHLGINLYSNVPAVLSEIVANAWDADASKVEIQTGTDELKISDNGVGMCVKDINEKFLMVGYQKRENGHKVTNKYKRKVMGRKGIGKLSMFSIANLVEIYTKKENSELNGLRINVEELERLIKNGDKKYHPEVITDFSNVEIKESGTVIRLTKLKKRISISTDDYLKKRLSRRFGVLGSDNNFIMTVNNKEVSITDRGYFNKLNIIWQFGESYLTSKELDKIENSFEIDNEFEGVGEYSGEKFTVTGWIGAVTESGDLQDEGENINKISLMIRGKVAQEDILTSFSEGGLYTKYLIGELNVDFLDEDARDDVTTSGRQSIKEEDELYGQFLKYMKSVLKKVSKDWDKVRDKSGTNEALKNKAIENWFKNLGPDKKKKAKSLFGKINKMTMAKEEKDEVFKQSVIAFELMRYKDNVDLFDELTPETIVGFTKVFNDLSDIEATLYYQIISERLRIIDKLDKNKDENVLEKIMQESVFDNLWLLDPSWDRATENARMEVVLKQELHNSENRAGLTEDEQRGRLDIHLRETSGKNVVIELKRAGLKIKPLELLEQVDKYASAMTKILDLNGIKNQDYEIICLIGQKHGDWSNRHDEMFYSSKARVMTYDEVITQSLKRYSEYFEKHKESNRLNSLLKEID